MAEPPPRSGLRTGTVHAYRFSQTILSSPAYSDSEEEEEAPYGPTHRRTSNPLSKAAATNHTIISRSSRPRIQVEAASDSPLASARPLSNHTASFSDHTATSSPNTVDTTLGPDTPPSSSSVLASLTGQSISPATRPHIHNHREPASKWARPSSSGSGSGSISHGICSTVSKRDRSANAAAPTSVSDWSFTGIVDRERMQRRASVLPPLEQGLGLDTSFVSSTDSQALRAPPVGSLSERRRSSRDSLSSPLRRLSFSALPRRLSDGCTNESSTTSSSQVSERSQPGGGLAKKHSWSIASLRGAGERSESDTIVTTISSQMCQRERESAPSPSKRRVHRASSWTTAASDPEEKQRVAARKAFGYAFESHSTQLDTIPPTPGEPSGAAATWIDPSAPSYLPAGLVRGNSGVARRVCHSGDREGDGISSKGKRLSLPAPRRPSCDSSASQASPSPMGNIKKGFQSLSLNVRFKAFNAKRRLKAQLHS